MIRRLLALIALCALATPAVAADPSTELGLELVPWSKKVATRRYQSPRDFDSTVKFFRDNFKGYKNIKWTREVSLPAVKYVHFENTNTGSSWQSVNIYELPDRHVRYFILERAEPGPKPVTP
jgi:hypothetical protein